MVNTSLAQEKKPTLQMCLRADSKVSENMGKALTEHELRHLRCGLVPENADVAGRNSGFTQNRQVTHRQWNASHLDEKSASRTSDLP
jgi:hypothetical protein